jgi:hypothetical protein
MNSLFQGTRESFEYRFDEVVVVFAFSNDLKVAVQSRAQAFEEMLIHFGGSVANILTSEFHVPAEVDASAEVYEHHSAAVVHGEDKAVASETTFVAEGIAYGIAESDSNIFHGVMLVDVEITVALQMHRYARMVRYLPEHVVEEVQASRDKRRSFAVEVYKNVYVSFACDARDVGSAVGGSSVSVSCFAVIREQRDDFIVFGSRANGYAQ